MALIWAMLVALTLATVTLFAQGQTIDCRRGCEFLTEYGRFVLEGNEAGMGSLNNDPPKFRLFGPDGYGALTMGWGLHNESIVMSGAEDDEKYRDGYPRGHRGGCLRWDFLAAEGMGKTQDADYKLVMRACADKVLFYAPVGYVRRGQWSMTPIWFSDEFEFEDPEMETRRVRVPLPLRAGP